MLFSTNPYIALVALGYSPRTGFDDGEFLSTRGPSGFTVDWFIAPSHTKQQIDDYITSQAFADYLEEHGGDATKTLRRLAREAIDASLDRDVALRAAVIELVNYARHISTNHNDLLSWLGTQTTLTNRAALNGFATLTPTNAEARQAIKDRIDAGEADT